VEQFNASLQRVGAAAKFITAGTCTSAVTTDVAEVTIASAPYVISNNMAATTNNKLNLYNANTGACIAGAAPTGPATTMWPFAMDYSTEQSKLFVLYYPFTAATSNAQIWSFNVSATTISGGTLVYNDVGGNIATINATPQNLAGDIDYYEDATEKFLVVATSFNSVLKLTYDSTTGLATLPAGPAFMSGSAWLRSISSVLVVPE
jgi:hypothetical protein